MAIVLSRVLQTGGKLMLEVSDRSVRSLRSQSRGTPLLNARLSSVSATLCACPLDEGIPRKRCFLRQL